MALKGINFAIDSGDILTVEYTLTESDGSPLPLAGATVKFLAHLHGTPKITKDTNAGITVTDATAGKIEVHFEVTDTTDLVGELSYEIKVIDSLGNGSHVVRDSKLTINKTYLK